MAFADLKADLDGEKAARLAAQIEVDVLAQAVKDLKISANEFASQNPTLEGTVNRLENKVVDGCDRTTSERVFTDQSQLERFSVKQERNQHT
jgi:hypothetical protein